MRLLRLSVFALTLMGLVALTSHTASAQGCLCPTDEIMGNLPGTGSTDPHPSDFPDGGNCTSSIFSQADFYTFEICSPDMAIHDFTASTCDSPPFTVGTTGGSDDGVAIYQETTGTGRATNPNPYTGSACPNAKVANDDAVCAPHSEVTATGLEAGFVEVMVYQDFSGTFYAGDYELDVVSATCIPVAPFFEDAPFTILSEVEELCNTGLGTLAFTVTNTGTVTQPNNGAGLVLGGDEFRATFAGIANPQSCRTTKGSCAVSGRTVSGNFAVDPGETITIEVDVLFELFRGITYNVLRQIEFDTNVDGVNETLFEAEEEEDIEVECGMTVDPDRQLGCQVHLPILNFQGQDDVCRTWIEVQNISCDANKAVLVTWGEPGFCPPQAAGPLKVECTGLLLPGSTWNLLGAQIPTGSKSGILFKFSAKQLSEVGIDLGFDDVVADLMCETLFFGVVGDADDYRRFKKAYNEGLDFAGIDQARAAGEGILAVDVLRHCPGDVTPGVEVSSKYIGIAGSHLGSFDPVFGGYGYYVPLVYADKAGFNSILYVQNGGLECSSVEIWFKAQDDCLRARICEIFTLAPGETFQFDATDCVGPDWQGSAWLRSSQVMGIATDIVGRDVLMTYVAEPAEINFTFDPEDALVTEGNQVAFGPLIYSEYQGWDTGVQVQNLSAVVAAKVKVYFLDRSGDIITTLVDWICPRGSQTYFLPVVADLPGNWVGSIRVESQEWWTPGSPIVNPPNIVGVATLIKYNDAARTETTEAIAYNLLPEHKIYDWQIGYAGGGLVSGIGLIAIPSLVKDLDGTGVTTEVAIANVVPKPGFTDFAIFIYDQNGLLDYVCEKLNEKQVEYIDLQTWGYVNPGFKGSAIISAQFWEHDVFNENGRFLRNLLGLGAVSVERTGTRLGEDVPGDEAAGARGIPFKQQELEDAELEFCGFGFGLTLCPGTPVRRPSGDDEPQFVCPPDQIMGALGDPDPNWPDTATYTANGRIFRDGVASQCNPPKACPGTFGCTGCNYDLYYFDNPDGLETCVTVTLNTGSCGVAVHAQAFTGEFPDGLAFACDPAPGVTYLGDVGSSLSQPFSFVIPSGVTRWTLQFHSNFGPNPGCTYSAMISGFACQ